MVSLRNSFILAMTYILCAGCTSAHKGQSVAGWSAPMARSNSLYVETCTDAVAGKGRLCFLAGSLPSDGHRLEIIDVPVIDDRVADVDLVWIRDGEQVRAKAVSGIPFTRDQSPFSGYVLVDQDADWKDFSGGLINVLIGGELAGRFDMTESYEARRRLDAVMNEHLAK